MEQQRIAVVGLGYVGLPLSVALARKFATIGFDVSTRRIEELERGDDSTHEVSADALRTTRHHTALAAQIDMIHARSPSRSEG